PAALVALVDRALLRDRELRWPHAASMLAELRAIQQGVPGTAPEVLAATEREPAATLPTLPDESQPQVPSKPRGRRSGVPSMRALLLASVVFGTVAVASVVKPRPGSTSPVPPASRSSEAALRDSVPPRFGAMTMGASVHDATPLPLPAPPRAAPPPA